jgi:hypothetical protein
MVAKGQGELVVAVAVAVVWLLLVGWLEVACS